MNRQPDNSSLSPAKAALLDLWRGGVPLQQTPVAAGLATPALRAPLSLAQERIWLVEQLQPNTPAYNLSFCARMAAPIDPDTLRQSFADLVERHGVLSAVIEMHKEEPSQARRSAGPPVLEVRELGTLGPVEAHNTAFAEIDQAIHRPFDLTAGPLCRLILYRLGNVNVLLMVIHHLIADGWSLGIALSELSQSYQMRAGKRTAPASPLPLQYFDFAARQRENARESAWREDLTYWCSQLADTPHLSLPTDRPRPRVMTMNGNSAELVFSSEVGKGLRRFAQEQDATLFMVLLSLIKVLLFKITGQTRLTVGTAVANRLEADTFGLIGNFINMIALQTLLDGDPTFAELLGRVRATCMAAFGHQQVPFERVVEKLRPERDLSRTVLFQVVFVLQPPTSALQFDGADVEPIELGTRTVRGDLEIHLSDRGQIAGRITYNTDLFDAETIRDFIERLQNLARFTVANPSARISVWSPLLPWETAALQTWSQGQRFAAPTSRVDRFIEIQADRHPQHTALISADRSLTYSELNRRANQLAHCLQACGVGPEVRVGVCLDRSVEMILAVLAVLKCGAAYIPLDPRYPQERLKAAMQLGGSKLIVTTLLVAETLALPGSSILLDRDQEKISQFPEHNPQIETNPDSLAYVIFTSGSTGTPKGVQITCRALANLAFSMVEQVGLQSSDVQVSVSSLAFDASVAEIFPALVAGATLVLAASQDTADGERLSRLLLSVGVTVLQATPSTWLLLHAAGFTHPTLRVLCGGEAATAELLEELYQKYQQSWHMYGPTETTVWSTAAAIASKNVLSLGAPIANTAIVVLDGDLNQCPIGTIGEMYIGGVGLSRGYLGDPALTAVRFVPDHLTSRNGDRLYRTGDLVRYTRDGSLHFLGRRDTQVKLRGHRIELGEIENRLAGVIGVRSSVVLLREVTSSDATLVAYLTLEDPALAGSIEHAAAVHLRQHLPEYMVPSAFIVLSEFPRTPAGKIDRLRLPAPQRARTSPQEVYVGPATQTERELVALLQRYLNVDRVGVDDDFFALGGHSLMAARLVYELRNRYQVEIMLQHLLSSPTVRQLAALVDERFKRKLILSNQEERLRRTVEGLSPQSVEHLLQRITEAQGSLRAGADQ